VLLVDYPRRVPPPPDLGGLAAELRIDRGVRSPKVLAMRRGIPLVAVGDVDEQALRRRGAVHLEDLCGPVTMA
jgi:hypothetical protein